MKVLVHLFENVLLQSYMAKCFLTKLIFECKESCGKHNLYRL